MGFTNYAKLLAFHYIFGGIFVFLIFFSQYLDNKPQSRKCFSEILIIEAFRQRTVDMLLDIG